MNSAQQTIDILRARPGIDVGRQQEGTGIIVEAGTQIYHLRLMPRGPNVLVEMSSTDPRLRACGKYVAASGPDYPATIGQFLGSAYDQEGKVFLDHWIGPELSMSIRFRNGTLTFPPTKSATVIGNGWRYDVF
jgi:hypothetical protein